MNALKHPLKATAMARLFMIISLQMILSRMPLRPHAASRAIPSVGRAISTATGLSRYCGAGPLTCARHLVAPGTSINSFA
jgi:hypothetical protein